jgi:hypothetical protein
MNIYQSEQIHLGKLCHRLLSSFSLRQLRQLADQLGLEAHYLGLDNPALKREAVVTMVAIISGERRLINLLAICTRWDPNFTASGFEFPTAAWTPQLLPVSIIEIAHRTLGWASHPYFTLTLPGIENHWTPQAIATGCHAWSLSLNAYPETISSEPSLYAMLMNVRRAIADDKAFAYFGVERTWGDSGLASYQPCIVLAPTVDQFDAIRIEQTQQPHADLDPIEIIRVLQSLDVKYGLDLLAAEMSTFEFQLTNMSKTQKAGFSRWLKAFAPLVHDDFKLESKNQSGNLMPIRLGWD